MNFSIDSGVYQYHKFRNPNTTKLTFMLLFLLGSLSSIYINLAGQLYISEVILIIIFPLLVLKNPCFRSPWVKRLTFFGVIWLIAQVITDIIRATPPSNFIRGWANISVFLISFLSLKLILQDNPHRINIYILGVVISGFLRLLIQPGPYFSTEPWKFGYGPVIILGLLLIVSHFYNLNPKRINFWAVPIILIGSLSFFLDARSIGTFAILTAFTIIISSNKVVIKLFRKSLNPLKFIFAILLLGSIAYGLLKGYENAAQKGWLGEGARQKYELQSSGALGVILGGRYEILSSWQAILDSPIIGHGSWATGMKYRLYLYRLREMGYNISNERLRASIYSSDLIPIHSHIFQNWVWAGVFGVFFWVIVLWLIVKSFVLNIRFRYPLFVLVFYFSYQSMWDIFFSPFGSSMRLEWAIRLVVFISAISLSAKNHKPNRAMI